MDTTVAIEIQKLAQKYERYLFLSGGKLAIQKCAFYFLTYKRASNWKMQHKTIKETEEVEIKLKEGFSENILSIKRLEVTEAYKTLGIYITPEGRQKEEIRYLANKNRIWAAHINVNNLFSWETDKKIQPSTTSSNNLPSSMSKFNRTRML